MKVLIWFLCIFANALITTLIKEAGVILGGIPTALMFAATLWLARTLCKKWDEHKENKAMEKEASAPKPQPYEQKTEHSFVAAPVPGAGWRCSCGRPHPKYETSCICGKSKFDSITQAQSAEFAPGTIDKILFCRKCGTKLLEGSQFCSKCGTEIIQE